MKARILFPDRLGIYRKERFPLLNDLLFIAKGIIRSALRRD